jgi:hypothetical protein
MIIKLRRDIAADWNLEDPVLAEGEPGWDMTNKVLKIGDGTTAWTALQGISGGGGSGGFEQTFLLMGA